MAERGEETGWGGAFDKIGFYSNKYTMIVILIKNININRDL
jgi:hypothetical protein